MDTRVVQDETAALWAKLAFLAAPAGRVLTRSRARGSPESRPERSDAPVLLLLHGFPSASHQFRRLIDSLGRHYRLIAPDYPGFGHTRTPEDFTYSFERLADVIEGFTEQLVGWPGTRCTCSTSVPRSASAWR